MDASNTQPYLSKFQRRVVWYLSQGYTIKSTSAQMCTSRQSVVDSLTAIRRKLNTATTVQAVLQAYQRGLVGVREDCGTRLSYVRHLDAGEDACPACRRANLIWLKRQSEPAPDPQPLDDIQVKIIRAYHCGRSQADLMQIWSVSRGQLHRAVSDMYARLGVAAVPREERRERALEVAGEQGYLTAQAPRTVAPARGARSVLSTREKEILAAVDGGVSLSRAAAVLGMTAPSLSSRLTEIYRKLDVAHLHRRAKRTAALAEARRRGYLD